MDKKNFARVADKKYTAGFYANVIFTGRRQSSRIARQVRAERGCVPRVVHAVARAETHQVTEDPVMANFNKVILAGNLTRDPELRYTPKAQRSPASPWPSTAPGKARAAKTEEVSFVDVDVWGRRRKSFPIHEKRPAAARRRPAQTGHVGRQKHETKTEQIEGRARKLFVH